VAGKLLVYTTFSGISDYWVLYIGAWFRGENVCMAWVGHEIGMGSWVNKKRIYNVQI